MERFREMLEHMSNVGIVVLSRAEHDILYTNKTFRRAYPIAETGESIEPVFKDDSNGMRILRALRRHENGEETDERYRLYLPDFGGMTDVWFDEFDWEETPAYVVYFTLIYLDEAEKFQSELSKIMGDALSAVYPVVTAVNLTGNAHMVLASDEKMAFHKGDHGNFTKAMETLYDRIHPDNREEFMEKVNQCYLLENLTKDGDELHLEFQMRAPDGVYHWIALRFVRVYTADRARVSCVGLMRNIDFRMNLQHKLKMTLDAAYAAIPGGVVQFIADGDLPIVHVNEEFCKLAEKTREDYRGGYSAHVIPEDRPEVCRVILEKAKAGEPFDVIYRIRMGESGRVRWVQMSGVKLEERDGKPVYLGIRMDITELKNTQIHLMEEQVRADLAMGATGNIRFEYDSRSDVLTMHYPAKGEHDRPWQHRIEKCCEEMAKRGEVYAEDVERLRTVFEDGNREAVEIRMRDADTGEYRWHRIKCKDVSDSDGHIYIVGIIEDISREKSLENTNEELLEQMGFMFQDSFQRLYVVDLEKDTCQIVRLGDEQIQKKPMVRVLSRMVAAYERTRIYPEDLDNFRAKWLYLRSKSAFSKGRKEVYFDVRVRDGLGPEYHWYTILIRRAQHNESRLICLAKCVDELKQQELLQHKYDEQIKYQKFSEKIIDSLGALVEFRDSDSGEHIMRTKQLTKIVATYLAESEPEYDLTPEKIEKITMAASMHDVGKISIPDAILNKPGRLTAEEFEVMKSHTTKGYDILNSIEVGQDDEFSRYCREICRYHHERYDGRGYPDHLVGDEIPIWGQIVSLVDVYDALVSPRVYKPPYSHEKAVEMILNGECGSFNPKLLKGLIACADELRSCYE
ncbi:MAG: PAS domain-containing protein [bacterium]|nr:PAS domain-containing protein [bacterium]